MSRPETEAFWDRADANKIDLTPWTGGLDALAGEFKPYLHHGLVREGLQKIAAKFSSDKDFGPTSVADFEGVDDPEEQERIQRDAYERVNVLLKKLEISI